MCKENVNGEKAEIDKSTKGCFILRRDVDVENFADNRKRYDWQTKYGCQAVKEIRLEACYLFAIFFVALFLIFANWRGWISSWLFLRPEEIDTFKKYAFYSTAGLLGGITFGMKYFYRVVARGYWHQDRRVWRIMSPFISMAVAFIIGTLVDSKFMKIGTSVHFAAIVLVGFLSGYFADEAVGKMYEVANVIFGKSAMTKTKDNE